jgi:hypothetical protein
MYDTLHLFVWQYLHEETVCGAVSDRWVETRRDCRDDDCSTSTYFIVELVDDQQYVGQFRTISMTHFSQLRLGESVCLTVRGFTSPREIVTVEER